MHKIVDFYFVILENIINYIIIYKKENAIKNKNTRSAPKRELLFEETFEWSRIKSEIPKKKKTVHS